MNKTTALTALRVHLAETQPAPGDRLPPERDLAARIGCSRQTIRAALDVLAREGTVWRHVGQGTFWGPRPDGARVRDAVLIELTSPMDLMEARLTLEPSVAARAAQMAHPDDGARLMTHVEAGRAARDPAMCEQADSAFHRAVAEIARNPVLLGVLSYLSDVRRRRAWQHEWGRTYRRIGVAEFRGLHSAQHATIAEAIARGDAEAAQDSMRAHLQTIRDSMSKTVKID
ncbi:FCD domain-containing protein [Marivita sp. S6314]|uniref:FadR/GntR family transcriptional regulator n=1 Tax=Marivita sp. S6314 TaxID=2926406 RepID=UPI001FF1D7BD|nr:FCD domain-containing protein [Marivita sp. S6314]MCK0151637.1 FCD domain-containing protein [Marivita sp. S6314]